MDKPVDTPGAIPTENAMSEYDRLKAQKDAIVARDNAALVGPLEQENERLRTRIGVLEAALLARDLLISDMYGYMEHDMTPEADGIFMAAREVIDALATQGKQE